VMVIYHNANICSTVSKVLRNKEKYLSQDDPNKSQQKGKGRFPDMERTLSNWVKKLDHPVTDAMLKDKIMQFAATVELADDDMRQKVNNSNWLEKFKIKHGLLSKSRKNSHADDSEKTATSSTIESGSQTPNISPSSPTNKRDHSPSRLSMALEMGKERKKLRSESPDHFVDQPIAGHRSFASISSAFSSVPHSTFSAGPISPTSPYFDNNPFNHHQSVQPISHSIHYQPRPRSQTFPMTAPLDTVSYMATTSADVKYMPAHTNDGPVDHLSVSIPSGSFGPVMLASSPEDGLSKHETAGAVQTPISSMGMPPPTSTPLTPAPSNIMSVAQSPSSPSLDETRRALEVVWSFFSNQQQVLEPDEFVVMNKLMDKLKLHHHGALSRGPELPLPGGMHRLDELAYMPIARSIAD
jgi:Tc5 transposase DNA-binding domain